MTNETISLDQLTGWLTRFRELVTEQVAYLTELDSAIGDADHGSNMTRGMAVSYTHLTLPTNREV